MCQILDIKASSFYAWARRGPSLRVIEDTRILDKIIKLREQKHIKRYGSPNMWKELRSIDSKTPFVCGHNRVARIMREHDIRAEIKTKHKYKLAKSDPNDAVPNKLNRMFVQELPNVAWVTDITYIMTKAGWMYLCVFIDLYSKIVAGWAISDTPDTELVLAALRDGICKRNPTPGLLVHSDQGCQYTSNKYKNVIVENKFVQSMSRRGNCWDNACAESFFSHLKCETIFGEIIYSAIDLKSKLFEYIEVIYNRKRRHSSCEYLSPFDYENKKCA